MQRFTRVFAVFLFVAFGVGSASAQDATPSSESLLAGQGFPELTLTASDDGLIDAPAQVESGRYLITLANTTQGEGELDLVQLTADSTYDETAALYVEASTGDEMPDEVYDTPIAGGGAVEGGETAQVILDLKPGDWVFGFTSYPEDGPEMASTDLVSVGGTFSELDQPAADVTVSMYEMGFDMPNQIDAGPLAWELTTTGDEPHFLELGRYPSPIDEDDFLSALTTFETDGTPDPNVDFDISQLDLVFDSSPLSSGMTNWLQLDLEPGHYVALCFFPDRATGMPHALLGAIKVFTVR